MRAKFVARAAVAAFAPLGALLWTAPAVAAQTCLGDPQEPSVCLDLVATPGDSVQASGMVGSQTFVRYDLRLRAREDNLSNVTIQVDVPNGFGQSVNFAPFIAPAGMSCAATSATELQCTVAQLGENRSSVLQVIANAPPYKGAATASSMTSTATLGWNGVTGTTSYTVAVAPGTSYVPMNTGLAVATAPEAAVQVTAVNPLWANMIVPPRPTGYLARVSITDAGPDRSASCTNGVFVGANGGPYLCRDTDHPRRWISTDLPDGAFTATSPVQFFVAWDQSIVSSSQIGTGQQTLYGVPPFAIFYNQTQVGVPYGSTRAFSNGCGSPVVAPCIKEVSHMSDGSWRANFVKPNDGSDMSSPLGSLKRVLGYFMSGAYASPVTVGPVIQ